MANEKALVTVSGSAVMEQEVITEAIDFAKKGFGGMPVSLPKGYDMTRAVKNLCFALPNVKNIQCATKESVYKAVHEYITRGLDIGKHQCALIVRMDKDENKHYTGTGQLTIQNEYFGNVAQAKRARPDIKDISSGTVVYSGEKIAIQYDEYGRLHIKHEADFTCWGKEIVGAYAIVIYADGSTDAELMTIAEIHKAWAQSQNGDKVHKDFPAEMCRKTVLNRLCKKLINKSDDAELIEDIDERKTEYCEPDYVVDIDAEDGYGVPVDPFQQESEMPEPKEVTAPTEQTDASAPQGDPQDEDYCITVGYKEYKNSYADCATGDYNARTKTIDVYPNKKKGNKGGEE